MISATRRYLLAFATPLLTGALVAQGVKATRANVAVEIVDGVATVELTLGVQNPSPRIAEAQWVLPLPEGAVADGFTTRIGDQHAITGEVLDAGRARAVYEAIVRRQRDPGLLEFAGRGCLRARLFPIPPGADAEVKVRWRQVLPELAGLLRWSYPVAATGLDGRAPETVSFAVQVESKTPIRTALSPTAGADVRLVDEHRVVASFEPAPGQGLPTELALFYGVAESALGMHVLAQRSAEADGHFALLISPKQDWDEVEIAPRTVTFVLDVSGSMQGKKIEQSKGALRQFLNGLRPVDRFDVVPFSTAAEPFFGSPVPATAENVATALTRVTKLEARGGTNLEDALRKGLPPADEGAISMCVLLSDGLPTVGQSNAKVLGELACRLVAERNARVFVLGVGNDVHTVLLDDLAEVGRGVRQYVRPHENVEEKASDLLMKIGKPVMTDLRLTVDGAEVSRMTPAVLPDLFAGSRLVVTGRYAKAGNHAIRLTGRVGDVEKEFVFEAPFPAQETANGFVPKLWATRRVATLLDEIRRNGQHAELLDEVRALGVEYQIVTPYTSHLVVEEALGVRADQLRLRTGAGGPSGRAPDGPGPAGPSTPGLAGGPMTGGGIDHGDPQASPAGVRSLGERLQVAGVLPRDATRGEVEALARQVAREMQRSARGLSTLGGQVSGERAVDDSVYLAQLVGQTASDQFFMGGGAGSESARLHALFVRRIGGKVFRLREGIWTDSAFDADAEYAQRTAVTAFSPEYFVLLREHPEIARWFALSDRLRVVLGDRLIEVQPAPAEGDPKQPAASDGDR